MATDPGNQVVTIKFYDPVDSSVVNKRQKDVTPTGIYAGGYLTRVDDTHVNVSALVCEIQSSATPYDQVKVETTSVTSNIVVGATTNEYIVVRWEYTGVSANDFAQIISVATPDTYDIVIGKCSYSGSTLASAFLYTNRSNPSVHHLFLKVEPEQTPSMYVRVRDGYVNIGGQSVHLIDNLYGPLVAPTSGSKTGAVYINDAGSVQISSDYTYGGHIVLASIALTAGQTTVVASNITDVRSFLTQPAIPDGTTIEKSSTTGKLQVKATGIQYTHINTNVADGTTIEKSGTTGKLQMMITSLFANSLAVPGYQKFPGGFILQWGSDGQDSSDHDYTATITFPISFVSACFYVGGTGRSREGGVNAVCSDPSTWTKTSASIFNGDRGPVRWIAFGK